MVPPSTVERQKRLELQDLEPSSQFVVKLWPTNGYSSASEIRVISDDGSTPVQTWNVPREGNRWVVAFGVLDLVMFGIVSVCVILIILGALGAVVSKISGNGHASDNSK